MENTLNLLDRLRNKIKQLEEEGKQKTKLIEQLEEENKKVWEAYKTFHTLVSNSLNNK